MHRFAIETEACQIFPSLVIKEDHLALGRQTQHPLYIMRLVFRQRDFLVYSEWSRDVNTRISHNICQVCALTQIGKVYYLSVLESLSKIVSLFFKFLTSK